MQGESSSVPDYTGVVCVLFGVGGEGLSVLELESIPDYTVGGEKYAHDFAVADKECGLDIMVLITMLGERSQSLITLWKVNGLFLIPV